MMCTASMRPRPEDRGDYEFVVNALAVAVASMRPRPEIAVIEYSQSETDC